MQNHFRFVYLLMCILLMATAEAQISNNPALKNINPSTVRPEDIPDESTLRSLGATEEEIKALMAIKNQAGSSIPKPVKDADIPKSEKTEEKKEGIETKKSEPEKIAETKSNLYGADFFKGRNLDLFDKAGSSRAPDHYLLSSEDQITITSWGYSNYNETFTIDKEGYIFTKELGRIYLKGMSLGAARQFIEKKFGSILDLRNSKMDVFLSAARTITVNVVGEVLSPGSYTVQAFNSAFNLLAMANGPNKIGSLRTIYIRRGGKTIKTLDVYDFLVNPNLGEDFFLENNDNIVVPSSEKVVHFSGEVKRSMDYELKGNEGIKSLINFSGGIKPSGYTKGILVKRIRESKVFFLDLNLDSLQRVSQDFILYDGDSIAVKTIPDVPEGFISISGAVRVPGTYDFVEGEKLSGLINRAQGILEETLLSWGYLVRVQGDYTMRYIPFKVSEILTDSNSAQNLLLGTMDKVIIFSKKWFLEKDSVTLFGSVKNPGTYLFGEGMRLRDLIMLAGGFKREAANNRIEVSRLLNIGKGNMDTSRVIIFSRQVDYNLNLDKIDGEFFLQPLDQVFVRSLANFEVQQNVEITGEVQYPGVYSLVEKNEKLFQIINRAGGLTSWAYPEAVKFFREEGNAGFIFTDFNANDLKNPNHFSNYTLKHGDKIVIPKINELVALKGAIEYPDIQKIEKINSPYIKGKSAGFYIRNFGLGFAKGSSRKRTYVVQPGGLVNKTTRFLFLKFYPKVYPGSTVVANFKPNKEKNERKKGEPVDWNKAIENVTVKLTGLLTVWLLINQVSKN